MLTSGYEHIELKAGTMLSPVYYVCTICVNFVCVSVIFSLHLGSCCLCLCVTMLCSDHSPCLGSVGTGHALLAVVVLLVNRRFCCVVCW
jgi:hypothetical protein